MPRKSAKQKQKLIQDILVCNHPGLAKSAPEGTDEWIVAAETDEESLWQHTNHHAMAKELRNKHGGDDCCRIVPMNYGLAIILNPTCSGAFVAMEQMLECAAAGHHFDDAEYMTALREEALARWDDMPTSDRMDLATDLFEDDISIVLEDKPEDENLIHYIVDRYDIN